MQINTLRLRAMLGFLGMFLPWIVVILSLLSGNGWPDSISISYYLDTCITPFMIILGASGILLISYRGYDKHDDIICTIAGILSIFICLFPCDIDTLEFVGTFQLPVMISSWIHNISAIGFFILLSYNALFLFTKGDLIMTENKKKRNVIYKVCGIGMFICLPLLVTQTISILKFQGGIWLFEMIALTCFGISWLTKSDIFPILFCDTPYVD